MCLSLISTIYFVINKNNIVNNNIVTISKGQSIEKIIKKNFVKINFIEEIIFRYYFKIQIAYNSKIYHYGDFFVDKNISLINFLNTISKPSNILNTITIIEGWSKKELSIELSKHFDDFKEINYFDILADTYYFEKNQDFKVLYDYMKEFKNKYLLEKKTNDNSLLKFNENEIMIIGSLIEKEGLDYQDKKNVASVIFNRLEKDMRLQIDATVLYVITNGEYNLSRKLLLNDLKVDNPFNTYKYNGLPPKPISYVGTKTIDIIYENYKTEYLFYFFNNSLKKHIFSMNYEDHKTKLNEYRNKK